MAKHTISDLYQMQSMSLNDKIRMTKRRIAEWVDEYGIDGVYVSFSGGKDSTVLLTIAREMYGDEMKGVFVDTGLEYPEIRQFVKGWTNIDWLKPKKTFRQVIEEYGYPFISKEVSEVVYGSRKYLTEYNARMQALTDRQTDSLNYVPNARYMADMIGVRGRGDNKEECTTKVETIMAEITKETIPKEDIRTGNYKWGAPSRLLILEGKYPHTENGVLTDEYSSLYNKSRYKFFLEAPFEISNKCCSVMKKGPIHKYAKESGRKPMTAQMASESRLRTSQWLKNGCNGFNMKAPISNPMSFWTEQDVLLYIKENKVPICSVYGEIVEDVSKDKEAVEGQMHITELDPAEFGIFDLERPPLKTTGCNRTGCMFCGYGAHLEKGEGRFERMKRTHPKQYDYIMRPKEKGGLNYKEVIDWINEHGNLNIKY